MSTIAFFPLKFKSRLLYHYNSPYFLLPSPTFTVGRVGDGAKKEWECVFLISIKNGIERDKTGMRYLARAFVGADDFDYRGNNEDRDKENKNKLTFRDLINDCTRNHNWYTFGCDLALGSPTDRITSIREQG